MLHNHTKDFQCGIPSCPPIKNADILPCFLSPYFFYDAHYLSCQPTQSLFKKTKKYKDYKQSIFLLLLPMTIVLNTSFFTPKSTVFCTIFLNEEHSYQCFGCVFNWIRIGIQPKISNRIRIQKTLNPDTALLYPSQRKGESRSVYRDADEHWAMSIPAWQLHPLPYRVVEPFHFDPARAQPTQDGGSGSSAVVHNFLL